MNSIDFGTLAGIYRAERGIRELLGAAAYENRVELLNRIILLSIKEQGELCVLLNALKDNCLVLRNS